MQNDRKLHQLPSKRQGQFLRFVEESSFSKLIACFLGAYLGVVLSVSLFELTAFKQFDVNWVTRTDDVELDFLNIVYFNMVTILTVGYGDFAPSGFGKVLSTIEALIGVGLFAGATSLLTVKALRPSSSTIIFSKYAYYSLADERFMVIFLNTSLARLENCSISSYFKLGRDWVVKPAITSPFLTKAVQTFFVDKCGATEISEHLTDGDCLRVAVSGNLMGSGTSASVEYKPTDILVIKDREFIANYEPFWRPDFGDPKFEQMFHYKPENSVTLADWSKPSE